MPKENEVEAADPNESLGDDSRISSLQDLVASVATDEVDVKEDASKTPDDKSDDSARGDVQDETSKDSKAKEPEPKTKEPDAKVSASTPPQDETKISRSEKRFQQLANEIKELKGKLQSEQKAKIEKENPTKPRAYVPEPTAPKYEAKELHSLRAEAVARIRGGTGTVEDENLIGDIDRELQGIRDYEIKKELWEVKNGQAKEKHDTEVNYYRALAVKNHPELANSESAIYRTYENLRQRLPELMVRKDGEHLIAEVAAMMIEKNSRAEADALKDKTIENLNKELAKFKGKIAPATPKGDADVSDDSDDEDKNPEKWFRSQMKALRSGK